MLSGLLFIAAAVLLGQALGFKGIVPLAVTVGVLAGLVQTLGLLRWVYLVPSLARMNADPDLDTGQRDANVAVFRAMHQYLGVGVGEHLGYLLTGIWSVLTGVAIVGAELLPEWMGWVGVAVGTGLIVGSARVSRTQRGARLGVCGHRHPDHLRRVVVVAASHGYRTDYLTTEPLTLDMVDSKIVRDGRT